MISLDERYFSGPQRWDYFESGMSSVNVHSSHATAKKIDIGTIFSLQTIDTRQHYEQMMSGKMQTTHSHGISDSNIFQAFLDEYLQPDEKKHTNHLHNPKLPWVTFKTQKQIVYHFEAFLPNPPKKENVLGK